MDKVNLSDVCVKITPSSEYLPPVADEGYHYRKPSSLQSKQVKSIAHQIKPNSLHIQIDHLRCFHGPDGYFQAVISVKSFIDNLPIIDIDTFDPLCRLHLLGVKLHINISAANFHRCNVHTCGQEEICIRLRFPQIFGMKALDDGVLTLQCKIQERVVTKMHTLRVGVSSAKCVGNK